MRGSTAARRPVGSPTSSRMKARSCSPSSSGCRRKTMRRLGIMLVLLAVAGCRTYGEGQRCNPVEYSSNGIQGDCDDGLACVYPTAPSCGVAYCCKLDSKGNVTDKHANCQPDPSLTDV